MVFLTEGIVMGDFLCFCVQDDNGNQKEIYFHKDPPSEGQSIESYMAQCKKEIELLYSTLGIANID